MSRNTLQFTKHQHTYTLCHGRYFVTVGNGQVSILKSIKAESHLAASFSGSLFKVHVNSFVFIQQNQMIEHYITDVL